MLILHLCRKNVSEFHVVLALLPFIKTDASFCTLLFSSPCCTLQRIWWPFPQMIDNEHTERYNFSFENQARILILWLFSEKNNFSWLFVDLPFFFILNCIYTIMCHLVVIACSFEITMIIFVWYLILFDCHLSFCVENWLPMDEYRLPSCMSQRHNEPPHFLHIWYLCTIAWSIGWAWVGTFGLACLKFNVLFLFLWERFVCIHQIHLTFWQLNSIDI